MSNVIDLQAVREERNHDWDEEFATYVLHLMIDEFVEAWDFSDTDDTFMKQFVRDMAIMREDVMAVIKRLNGEHHDQHQYMDEYWEMIDNTQDDDIIIENDETKQ